MQVLSERGRINEGNISQCTMDGSIFSHIPAWNIEWATAMILRKRGCCFSWWGENRSSCRPYTKASLWACNRKNQIFLGLCEEFLSLSTFARNFNVTVRKCLSKDVTTKMWIYQFSRRVWQYILPYYGLQLGLETKAAVQMQTESMREDDAYKG